MNTEPAPRLLDEPALEIGETFADELDLEFYAEESGEFPLGSGAQALAISAALASLGESSDDERALEVRDDELFDDDASVETLPDFRRGQLGRAVLLVMLGGFLAVTLAGLAWSLG